MPKRKRTVEETVRNKLEKHRIDIFRALSSAKAFERKRFSTRLREPGITANKKARLDHEYAVLKSLDLRQTARNHLHSNLLRIKAIETSNDIPDELRAVIPRRTLPQEEIILQNNVISVLCNTVPARQALDRAVADICETLSVQVPMKSKRLRDSKRVDAERQPSDRISNHDEEGAALDATVDIESNGTKPQELRDDSDEWVDASDDESEFEGFGSDDDETGPIVDEDESVEASDEEVTISKYDGLLGGSSDEEEEFDEEFLTKYRGKEQPNLDDISLGSASDVDMDEDNEDVLSETGSSSISRPSKIAQKSATEDDGGAAKEKQMGTKEDKRAKREEERKRKAAKVAAKNIKTGDSTFLPTLMGGYISGSESASDIDAPPKKRRGQRARQAIWEKKYGARANHLKKATVAKSGRDTGWDMKRGAVDPEDHGRGKPWKRGGRASHMQSGRQNRHHAQHGRDFQEQRTQPEPKKITKRDDEGHLHPSWEARKKAKEAQADAAFSGQKIVFD